MEIGFAGQSVDEGLKRVNQWQLALSFRITKAKIQRLEVLQASWHKVLQ